MNVLPFFTHLREEDQNEIDPLQEELEKIKFAFAKIEEQNTDKVHLCKAYIQNIYSLILLLIKINSLLDFKESTSEKTIQLVNQFISGCYECLIEAVKLPEIAESVWKFNGYFFTLCWKNRK